MKKAVILIFVLFLALGLWGQTHYYEGRHYRVASDISYEFARETARKMDAYFDFFTEYFHFDTDLLEGRLNLRFFGSKNGFDEYLFSAISETRDSFVFLQYSNSEKNELIGFSGQDGKSGKDDVLLAHYGLVQYIKSFVKNPPLWMQMGFAVYFEKSFYNPAEDRIVYVENLDWLNTLKSYLAELSPAESLQTMAVSNLLSMDLLQAEENRELAYAQSWGLVHFLMNTPEKTYSRLLWDSLSALDGQVPRSENEDRVFRGAFRWVPLNELFRDFSIFIDDIKTFPELVQMGITAYNLQDYQAAESCFLRAAALREDHPLPRYYLGLISYIRRDYAGARGYYEASLAAGGEESLGCYALGVNAYAEGQLEEAKVYLERSFRADPAGHGERALELLNRIEAENP